MRILVIGGSGFIGSRVVERLAEEGHNVVVVHRGTSERALPANVAEIQSSRDELGNCRRSFEDFAPDVVLDCILSSRRQAEALIELFRDITPRIVALSSQDVYRAAGLLHRIEDGPLQPVPLTESSELRTAPGPYPKESLQQMSRVFAWLDEDYDKIPVEHVILGDARVRGTILRLPMVSGPGDPLHRLFGYLKRMDDGRPYILLQEDAARWRAPRGYVENVAAAVALATTSGKAVGKIYNVAEAQAFEEQTWVQRIGQTVGWKGRVIAMPASHTPAHLKVNYRSEQHWEVSSKRIRAELGFAEPVPFGVGLMRTIEWERIHPPGPGPSLSKYEAEDAAVATWTERS
ncbi:MAG: NAD-dependent epimerase/dehydratase family protein [Bryobacteraceae bacterium]